MSNAGGSVYNNTLSQNTCPYEGGIYLSNSSPEIFNNIIYANSGYGIRENDTTSDPSLICNDIFDNALGVYLDEGITAFTSARSLNLSVPEAVENRDCDPDLVTPDDYHLSRSSCCIDTGINTGAPLHDLDGDPRPLGARTDIGCDEVVFQDIPAATTGFAFVLAALFTGYTLNTIWKSIRKVQGISIIE